MTVTATLPWRGEYLHVDFDAELGAFYYGACGFRPTSAGLIEL